MSDPTSPRPDAPPPLEPWALELLQREGVADPRAPEETARVVALLRELDGPERDPERVERLIAALAEQRARPVVIRVAFEAARRIARPAAALAIAAGVAGLLAIAVTPGSLSLLWNADGRESAPHLVVLSETAPPVPTAAAPARPEPVRRRATPVIRPQLVNVSAFAPPSLGQAPAYDRAAMELAFVRGLDRRLNQLLIDPDAFVGELERAGQRDRLIARLAGRAAERGDAVEIALRVRESQHPIANQIFDRMLQATLVADVSGKRP